MTTTRCLINSLISMLFCIYGGAGISGLKASVIFSGTVERDTTVYLVADEAPRFEGELETWLGENIRYPQEAWDNEIAGRVIMAFVIEPDGSISGVKVLRGAHPSLDMEATRVIGAMPKWSPAKIGGKAVRFYMTFPLLFKIEQPMAGVHSYEDYVAMLNREAGIPLDEVAEEQDQEILQILMDRERVRFRTDAEAYLYYREDLRKKKNAVTTRAAGLLECYNFKSANIKVLAAVFEQIIGQELALVEGIGKENFIKRYAALSPRIRHLRMQEEVRLKDCMNEREHRLYFTREISPRIQAQEEVVGDSCSCGCIFHILSPLTAYRDLNYALAKTVRYPIVAQERNIQGKVWLSYTVGIDGKVSVVEILRSADPVLDKEAVRALKSITFPVPPYCLLHKRRVALRSVAPVNFRLQ